MCELCWLVSGRRGMRRRGTISRAIAVGLLTLCTAAAAQAYPNADLLVDTAWLADNGAGASTLIVDMRQPRRFEEAHVPGAVNLPVDAIVATVAGVSFEFEEARVLAALRGIGLRSDHTVVVYDDLGMMNAARLFWTLEYVGHDDVRVLDGGWDAWVAAGLPVEAGPVERAPSRYELQPDPGRLIAADELASRL